MEALGYLAFSAVLYLTWRFFRTVFKDYIFNKELYRPDHSPHSLPPEEDHPAGFSETLSKQACY